jgi:hypothetical protein
LVFPLLMMLACRKGPLTNEGNPVFTTGLSACSGANFPIHLGGSSSCCPAGGYLGVEGEWHVYVAKVGTKEVEMLAHRYIGKACTPQWWIQGKVLEFGPCGAAKDPVDNPNWMNGINPTIFRPASGVGCGYQVTNPDGSIFSNPENYTDQPLYPGVTASCRFTDCLAAGVPAVTLFVGTNVPVGPSLGRVRSDPPGITLSGAGKASALFPGDVTLIAEPTGKHARAVFSGDCNKAGEYGQRAEGLVKLAPDQKVTVTFECEKGFTCGTR